jgi:hypothetical protein
MKDNKTCLRQHKYGDNLNVSTGGNAEIITKNYNNLPEVSPNANVRTRNVLI